MYYNARKSLKRVRNA